MSTIYSELQAKRAEVQRLEEQVRACDHYFVSTPPLTKSVKVAAYDYWAGPGYGSAERYAQVSQRTCCACGLVQTMTKLAPNDRGEWLSRI